MSLSLQFGFRYFTIFGLSFCCLLGCAIAPRRVVTATPEHDPVALYHYHTPKEIYEILAKSPVQYDLKAEDSIAPYLLSLNHPEPYAVNPMSIVSHDSVGHPTLAMATAAPGVSGLFQQATGLLKAQDFISLLDAYKKAIALDSTFFKSWTNLGETYYHLGQYPEAERCLRRALVLNSIDYQACFYLADLFDARGLRDSAMRYMTAAYMLNKNDPNIERALHRLLAENGMRFNDDRLAFPFSLRKTGVSRFEIALRKRDGAAWLPLAQCLACWEMEPSFHELLADEQYGVSMQSVMYRECLLCQASVTAARKENKEETKAGEDRLLDVVNDRLLPALVYWEILAGEYPAIVLLLSEEEKAAIVRYIGKYVYTKK